ncbi:nucleoside deaminase [Aeromonas sp. BIGb0445]|uniref:nucleoside deaminase n=1 Tax=Aeromonas sp. BIGb0445 TaxID=2940593 RepID=UPI002167AC26|nr:deaminase [Aeromonas sp. BIGb0445]MCS3458509.1 tRNA(Arg) A34 adenosine deaminase TadA [Aeromonas sp. BIGb0445]
MTDTSTPDGSLATHQAWLVQTVELALDHRRQGGRPFAALLVRDGQRLASAVNLMHLAGDPTRHAELEALREASQHGALKGAVIYASGHPCPMCLCALVMNGISAVYYAFDNQDAAPFGFDSAASYARLRIPLSPPPLPLIKLPSPISAAVLYGPDADE